MVMNTMEKNKAGAEGRRHASRELFSVVVGDAEELSWHLKQTLNEERK